MFTTNLGKFVNLQIPSIHPELFGRQFPGQGLSAMGCGRSSCRRGYRQLKLWTCSTPFRQVTIYLKYYL
jgi:hypothetical protein